jgi:hypothetical protein
MEDNMEIEEFTDTQVQQVFEKYGMPEISPEEIHDGSYTNLTLARKLRSLTAMEKLLAALPPAKMSPQSRRMILGVEIDFLTFDKDEVAR